MLIDTNIYTKLTDTEIHRFFMIEAALSKLEDSGQIDLFKIFLAAFHDLDSDWVATPGSAEQAYEMIDEAKVYLELMNCLPELRELREVEPYVLLGKMLYYFYKKLARHVGRYRPNISEIKRILIAENRPKLDGRSGTYQLQAYYGYFRKRCTELADRVGKEIAEHSVPKLVNLIDFPPDYEIVMFGYSATQPKRSRLGGIIDTIPVADWVLARYLLVAKEYRQAANLFENSRSEATEAYQIIALTAWMDLAWSLHTNKEETRKRFTQSVARVARCQNPSAKAEVEEIEILNRRLSGAGIA